MSEDKIQQLMGDEDAELVKQACRVLHKLAGEICALKEEMGALQAVGVCAGEKTTLTFSAKKGCMEVTQEGTRMLAEAFLIMLAFMQQMDNDKRMKTELKEKAAFDNAGNQTN